MLSVGKYRICSLVCDLFRLDGGAMFGSVPKALWSKQIAADERNRIQLACRILVIRDSKRTILVDVGCGRKWTDKERDIYAIEHQDAKLLHEQISGVTHVVLTHLHFDHAGGVSYLDKDGTCRLSFPDATHYLSRVNWEHAKHPGPRERASYLEQNIAPLTQAKLKLVDDGEEILPDIRVQQFRGHTHGLLCIYIGQGKGAVVYPADVIPTAHHIPVPYVMGYDLWPEKTMEEKEAFLKEAVAQEWVVVFEHDASTAAGCIVEVQPGRFGLGRTCEI